MRPIESRRVSWSGVASLASGACAPQLPEDIVDVRAAWVEREVRPNVCDAGLNQVQVAAAGGADVVADRLGS